jgi:hypothetical protein
MARIADRVGQRPDRGIREARVIESGSSDVLLVNQVPGLPDELELP